MRITEKCSVSEKKAYDYIMDSIITNRDQLEKMSHSELVEYAMIVGTKFKELESRIAKLEGGEAITSDCNLLLIKV